MIALIVAYASNCVMGNNGYIPWKIKGEQKRFKDLTTGNVVVMGRRSFEEIGHPLPGRTNIIVSNTVNYQSENCYTVSSLQEAIKSAPDRDIYISGGAGLYKQAINLVDKMFITEINQVVEGDTFFPYFDKNMFERELIETFEGDIPYSYVTYTRKVK